MGGGDCPMDNELAIAPFLPIPAADIPSSSHSHPPPPPPLHHIHTLKCHLKIKHKKHKPCMKLKLNHKHKHTDILIGHQFPPRHSHSHSPPPHHHHDRVHKKHHHHHHHGLLYSHGNHPFAAHPMAIHMGMPGFPPHQHH